MVTQILKPIDINIISNAKQLPQRDVESLKMQIKKLATEKKAIILTHIYQRLEVQDIADHVGDSLALSRYAAKTDADIIIFCGVHFMAETAKLLNPNKTVLLPDLQSGCPMADMISPEDLQAFKNENPGSPVVCYINSSAAVKAESDACCTSTNAVEVVNSFSERELIFAPDKGSETRKKIAGKGSQLTDDLNQKFNAFLDDMKEKYESIKEEASEYANNGKASSDEYANNGKASTEEIKSKV